MGWVMLRQTLRLVRAGSTHSIETKGTENPPDERVICIVGDDLVAVLYCGVTGDNNP
jgi:hypothetical protein